MKQKVDRPEEPKIEAPYDLVKALERLKMPVFYGDDPIGDLIKALVEDREARKLQK